MHARTAGWPLEPCEIRTPGGAFRFSALAAGEYEILIPAIGGIQPCVLPLTLATGQGLELQPDLH